MGMGCGFAIAGGVLGVILFAVMAVISYQRMPSDKARARAIIKSGQIKDQAEVNQLVKRLQVSLAKDAESKHLSQKLIELKDKA